ncbi:hypothetical protein BGW80DRAFT_1446874 [Lactifluus volemus]|nr:hypothetical protein BGW80DRAFT_1446874 [Lactifluus volemus]
MDVGDGGVEKMCWKKELLEGRVREKEEPPLGCATRLNPCRPRTAAHLNLNRPRPVLYPYPPTRQQQNLHFRRPVPLPISETHSNYSSPSDTRHQTIVTHRALLKHPSWRRRGAQWNIISYVRSRSSGKHIILSATVAVMVVVVMVKIVVR